jgi:hypothetical protein
MDTLLSCFYDAFEKLGVPENINCDNEFNKHEINALANSLDIKMWFSDPEEVNKNAVVERCNRTIAEMLEKWRLATGRHDWYKVLDSIVNSYNHQYHSTVKSAPVDIFKGKKFNRQKIQRVEPNVSVGDIVRVKQKKRVFGKGDEPRYSTTAHKVIDKKGQRLQLEGEERLRKGYEVRKVDAEPSAISQKGRATRHINIIPISRILPARHRKKREFDADDLYNRRG